MEKISHSHLLEILSYDKETGNFTWAAPRPKIRVGQKAGYLHHKGYINLEIYGKPYAAHRLAWFYVTGKWPVDQIDHINRTRNDNRFENLREATNSQNRSNTPYSNNSTGFKGVNFLKKRGVKKPYVAQISLNGTVTYLGSFATPEEAHEVYKEATRKHRGQFACL